MTAAVLLAAVSCIDEDLSKCPPEEREMTVRYSIVIEEGQDSAFVQELTSVHMGFWDNSGTLVHEKTFAQSELPEDLTFTVTLPADRYSHIVTANCQTDADGGHNHFGTTPGDVEFTRPETAPDTIKAMRVPPYSGTLTMDTEDSLRGEYTVEIHPVVGKMEITVAHREYLTDIRCMVGGTLGGYYCWDDRYEENSRLRTDATEMRSASGDSVTQFNFYTFPTTDGGEGASYAPATKARSGDWELYIFSYCTITGKTIRHKFMIDEPLYPGQVYRNRFEIDADDVSDVGVEVDTDWKPGNDMDVDM